MQLAKPAHSHSNKHNRNPYIVIAALFGMLAVIFGAFGAHGLENRLDIAMLARFQTGVEYQFYHTFALLVVALLMTQTQAQTQTQSQAQKRAKPCTAALTFAAWAFIVGIILFSGSLYSYALTGVRQFGMITPIGGLAFIVGWASLMRAGWRLSRH